MTPPLDASQETDEAAVEQLEGLGALYARYRNDCNRLADEVVAYVERNAALFARLEAQSRTLGRAGVNRAYLEKYGVRIEAAMDQMNPTLASCASNVRLERAVRSVPGVPPFTLNY